MLDVHPPHAATHSWRDFLIHIATIVVGLLIAVGLEQTVEIIHHHRQVTELREQMRGVFQKNLTLAPQFLQHSAEFRTYLVELQTAVDARISGHPLPTEPDRNDQRMRVFTSTPSLGPYDVAIQNGTIALLPANEISLYNRVSKQREYLTGAIDDWFHSIAAMEDFEKQFSNSTGNLVLGSVVTTPNLSTLSTPDLLEYRKLIAAVINATDRLMTRTVLLNVMGQAILNGATDEDQLINALGHRIGINLSQSLGSPRP